MRRLIAGILSILLFTTNMSLAVTTHYCAGTVAKVGVTHSLESFGCGMIEMQQPCEKDSSEDKVKRSNCCENQSQFFSIEDDYSSSSIDVLSFELSALPVDFPCDIAPVAQTQTLAFNSFANPPPSVPRYIQFEQFLL